MDFESKFSMHTPVVLTALTEPHRDDRQQIESKNREDQGGYLEANLVQLDSTYEIAISIFALLTTSKCCGKGHASRRE